MTNSQPIVSIIIPHWNGIDVLSECIESLKKSTLPSFEIIVSDNASSDGSQAWIKEIIPILYFWKMIKIMAMPVDAIMDQI